MIKIYYSFYRYKVADRGAIIFTQNAQVETQNAQTLHL